MEWKGDLTIKQNIYALYHIIKSFATIWKRGQYDHRDV